MSPQDIFVVNHDGAWREEIELEKRGQNEQAFTGTITMTKQYTYAFLTLTPSQTTSQCVQLSFGEGVIRSA